jgi:hypothetical protein
MREAFSKEEISRALLFPFMFYARSPSEISRTALARGTKELRRKAYWKQLERKSGKAAARRAKENFELRSKERNGDL